jgi:hypothetical protein
MCERPAGGRLAEMTATLTAPPTSVPKTKRRTGRRERLAALERPLPLAGLALVALHLLDLAFSGPDTSVAGVLAIVGVDAGGPTTRLWELPDSGHTGGLRTHPAEYEQRTTAFLDRALGFKETS